MNTEKLMTDLALQAMEQYPKEWAKVAKTVRERLHDDADFRLDMKAYSDTPDHFRNHQVEWFYAVQCHTKLLMGDIGACRVLIEAHPRSDSEIERNHKILQDALEPPFHASVDRGYDNDGSFGWDEPITATRFVKTRRGFDTVLIKLDAWSAPLEIGYTRAYRSFMHLLGAETALVRWCYDDDFIRVFKMLPHAVDEFHKKQAALFERSSQDANRAVIRAAMEQLSLWN